MASNSQTESLPQHWWAVPAEELAERLDVDPEHGPDPGRVDALRARYGRNQLEGIQPTGTWELLWESVTSPMMLLLLAVAGISLALGQYREAAVMAFVVLTYVGVELINKRRTDRTLARLRELQAPQTRVLRGGERCEVRIDEVVVGDVVPLGPGTRIPADGRLLSTAGLLVNEAPLTGESAPQPKDAAAAVEPDGPLAERPTAVFAGTTVLDGEGRALVVAVGSQTELGRIAVRSAEAADERTPLQQEMDDLARTLAFAAVGVSLLIPLAGLLRGFDLERMLLTWLSLTFLMVPGQPPIIITMALALAALELARRDVIVRRLAGAETLGSVDVILADKTGTITENEMALAAAVRGDGTLIQPGEGEAWRGFLRRALPAVPQHPNDPTDQAIRAAAGELDPPVDAGPGELVDEQGFARGEGLRRMVYRRDGERHVYLAGSPETVLEKTEGWAAGEETRAWSGEQRDALRARVEELAAGGRRITAYACGSPDELTFAGCAVLHDPIREGVGEAIDELAQAGVRTVMVTGDRPATARSVAREIGLDTSSLLTGPELEDADLAEAVRRVNLFARTSPEQKLQLVEALQAQGQTVAVTGDGVNDAPALRAAHLGVAMGGIGTDVAREAGDLILTDDDLARLPEGVAIGRKAYDNFRKGLTYYLSAKAILLSAFLVPLVVGVPFPFAPIHIIFTELLMDLASSTIFITEEAEPDVMRRGPRRRARFLSWEVGRRILRNSVGLVTGILAVYFGSLALGYGVGSARTAAWATWLLGHILLALTLKQERVPLLRQGLLSNRFGVVWLAGMIGLVLAMTLVPFVRTALNTTPLSGVQWGMVAGGALLGSVWLEMYKWVRNREVQRGFTAQAD